MEFIIRVILKQLITYNIGILFYYIYFRIKGKNISIREFRNQIDKDNKNFPHKIAIYYVGLLVIFIIILFLHFAKVIPYH